MINMNNGKKPKFWDIEVFKKEARKQHGDKFDYSRVVLSGANGKILIVCPNHGEFEQTANGHLRYGCYNCNPRRKRTSEDFIKEAKAVHGNKFDYSLVEYVRSDKKVLIICPKHGVFKQEPRNHLLYDCSKCKFQEKLLSNNEFIKKCKEIHGDRYDYSLTEYKGCNNEVTIICKEHGEFRQEARVHQSGHHCKMCGNGSISKAKTKTTQDFISDAMLIHGNLYSYDSVEYKHSGTPITITCKKHGDFIQKPRDHLSGSGCLMCFDEKRGEVSRKDTEYFIERSTLTHSDRYDYSISEYIGASKPIKIICKDHGVFEQRASDHYVCGCPKCGRIDTYSRTQYVENAKLNHKGLSNLYFIEVFDEVERFYKIGISVHPTAERFLTPTQLPYDYHELLVVSLPAEDAWDLETHLHRCFGKLMYKPLCDFGGSAKECFNLSRSDEMRVVCEIQDWLKIRNKIF